MRKPDTEVCVSPLKQRFYFLYQSSFKFIKIVELNILTIENIS